MPDASRTLNLKECPLFDKEDLDTLFEYLCRHVVSTSGLFCPKKKQINARAHSVPGIVLGIPDYLIMPGLSHFSIKMTNRLPDGINDYSANQALIPKIVHKCCLGVEGIGIILIKVEDPGIFLDLMYRHRDRYTRQERIPVTCLHAVVKT